MRVIRLIKKPLDEIVFFLVCLICIIPPIVNHFLLLFKDIELDFLFLQFLAIAIIISYVMTTIIYLLRKWKFIKVFAYVFVILLAIVYFFLKIHFGTNMSPLIVTMIAETNMHESSEFLNSYLLSKNTIIILIISILLLFIIIKAELTSVLKNNRLKKYLTVLIILSFPLSIYGIRIVKSLIQCNNMNEINDWYDTYYPYAMDNISTLMYSLYIPHITSKEIDTIIHHTEEAIKTKSICTEKDSIDIVFVIGESYIKSHAHLYGYALPTTPEMDKERSQGNLFVFNDMISPYNTTTQAIKNILCTNNLSDGESWSESIYFPSIFKQAGYHVYMWDNQKNLGTFLIYTFTINSLLYNRKIIDYSYSKYSNKNYPYDGQLVESFFKEKTGKQNFVIFHLMGQHVVPSERYPDKENVFTFKDIKRNDTWLDKTKKQSIAEYDNATRYNDLVMGRLFDYYRLKNAVIIYLSDHGEEIYDIRDFKGRDLENMKNKSIVKYQNDIPFVIWCSDKYQSLHPDIIKDLKDAINKKAMSDNICHLLFRLASIETPFYQAKRDLSNRLYECKKRIIYDKYNYDDIQ